MSRFVFLFVFLSLIFTAFAFAETAQKEVTPDQLVMDNEALILWADTAASQIMTFNYNDYEQRFELAKNTYFNLEGFKKFSYTLAASEWFNPKAEYQQIVIATSNQSSQILKRHELSGRDTVELQVPLILTIRAGTKMVRKAYSVLLTVQRVPPEENAGGIAIIDWRAEQR